MSISGLAYAPTSTTRHSSSYLLNAAGANFTVLDADGALRSAPPATMYESLLAAALIPGPHQAEFTELAMAAAGTDPERLYFTNLHAAQIPGPHQIVSARNAVALAGTNREYLFTAHFQAAKISGPHQLASLRQAISYIDNDTRRHTAVALSIPHLGLPPLATASQHAARPISDGEFERTLLSGKLSDSNRVEIAQQLLQHTEKSSYRIFQANLMAAKTPNFPNRIEHARIALKHAGTNPNRIYHANVAAARVPGFPEARKCADTALNVTPVGSDRYFEVLLVTAKLRDPDWKVFTARARQHARGNPDRLARIPFWMQR